MHNKIFSLLSRIKNNFVSGGYFRNLFLPNVVICMLLGVALLGIYLFKYYGTINENSQYVPFSYSVTPGQFTVLLNVHYYGQIDPASKEYEYMINIARIMLSVPEKITLKRFCINHLVAKFKMGSGEYSPTETDLVHSLPACADIDPQYLYINVTDNYYSYGILFTKFHPIVSGINSYSSTGRNYFPFDSLVTHIEMVMEYEAIFDDGSSEQDVISPVLSIGISNDKPLTDLVLSGKEINTYTTIEKYAEVSNSFWGKNLYLHQYEVHLDRPLVVNLLFIFVMIAVTFFIFLTFRIRNTEIFLASILVFLFGINNLKQIIPSPENLVGKVGILEILIPLYYLLIFVSGINFLIRKYLESHPVATIPAPAQASVEQVASAEKVPDIKGNVTRNESGHGKPPAADVQKAAKKTPRAMRKPHSRTGGRK